MVRHTPSSLIEIRNGDIRPDRADHTKIMHRKIMIVKITLDQIAIKRDMAVLRADGTADTLKSLG